MATLPKESMGIETPAGLVALEMKKTTSPKPNRTNISQSPREILNWQKQQQESDQGQSPETADQAANRCHQKHRCCQKSIFCKYLTYVLPSERYHQYRHHRQHRNLGHNHQRPGRQQSSFRLLKATQNRFKPSSITSLSDRLCWSPRFKGGQLQSSLMTILMFVVAFSGHAVIASQRDASKSESILGKNANVIPYMINPAQSNGNTNDVSNENVNFYNAIISSLTAVPDVEMSLSLTTGNSMASGNSPIASTAPTITVASTAATSSVGGGGTGSNSLWATSRNSIEGVDDNRGGPYFDKSASKNITALLGKTAYLNCRVKNLGNKTMLLQVSWVRHRDIHLLTVGRYTYTSDQRFRAIHQPQTDDWVLQIKYPQHRDAGIYECQVSTTPHMSHYIYLSVVEPSTEIIGAPDLYIESGSTINLTCVILNSPEPPAYIFWNHNNAIINYDSPRGGVSVVTHKGETTTSFLLIKSARPSDSGHYQCNPSNAKPKSVTVHVLNGVSHSVSRGVPSSNAARGTSVSANVSGAVSIGLPLDLLLQLSVCQMLYIVASVTEMMRLMRRLLGACVAVAFANVFCKPKNEFMGEVVERVDDEFLLTKKNSRSYSSVSGQEIRKQKFEQTKEEEPLRAAVHLHKNSPKKSKLSEISECVRHSCKHVSQNDSPSTAVSPLLPKWFCIQLPKFDALGSRYRKECGDAR